MNNLAKLLIESDSVVEERRCRQSARSNMVKCLGCGKLYLAADTECPECGMNHRDCRRCPVNAGGKRRVPCDRNCIAQAQYEDEIDLGIGDWPNWSDINWRE